MIKTIVAARVAAKLRAEGAQVEMKHGGLGELRVDVDGRDVYDGNRFLYSTPGRILRAVREALLDRDSKTP